MTSTKSTNHARSVSRSSLPASRPDPRPNTARPAPDPIDALPLTSLEGTVSLNPRGFGFVSSPDPSAPDPFLSPPLLSRSRLIDGDVVRATYDPTDERTSALSVELLTRSRTRLFGVVEQGVFVADPFLAKEPFVVQRPFPAGRYAALVEVHPNDTVRILRTWDNPTAPDALYARALERARVAERDVTVPAPDALPDSPRRKDLTRLTTFTIDGPESRDLDDAISIEDLGQGVLRLYVHIADVASAVPLGSPADLRARSLATSTYLPGFSVPMMPESLAYDECSLLPHQKRRALTVRMDLGEDGRITAMKIEETLITSNARFTYDEVAHFLSGQPLSSYSPTLENALRLTYAATTRLGLRRKARGGLRVNEGGRQSDLCVRYGVPAVAPADDAQIAHDLIEEAMIATNEAVANWLTHRGVAGVFRTHDAPAPEAMPALTNFANQFGVAACLPDVLTPFSLAALEAQLTERAPDANLFNVLADYLPRALYQARPGLHFGLASTGYVHFTSPIRRYADLTVHRIIKSALAGQPCPVTDLEQLCVEINEGAGRAARAESVARSLFYAVFFQSRPRSSTYEAYVSRVSPRGVFVRLNDYGVGGWMLSRDLSSKQPRLSDDGLSYAVGARTFTLGQKLTVAVQRTDVEAGSVDFVPAGPRVAVQHRSTPAPKTRNRSPHRDHVAAA